MKSIEDPILRILSNGQVLSFHSIHLQVQFKKRTFVRRLSILVQEGKIKRYRSLQDSSIFRYALAGELIITINGECTQ